ncbi:PAS and ANTAR domain-containing protein [Mycolicibacterium vaccae]|uniref:Putative PAS/PAC sensor protein n=1 Tax=Mycolicibacterium vaccae ATCC 25954 TaxID=1194972 RepID=K0UU63_MYCVA|nr:PAS and ANTAR domain-containing protein [Mycolicibacterium vaccae]ANI42679.1 transcription antitermination regulator [Mycolicibacterium vaccae 95051]EJZ10737.1 putative PAS/PAC sensor protein [Mycolicibacterium vaccae ATCC 25954]MCV7060929.1 PAS and ANTAR domain-containing protein [Mycolicibacterium vaccae]
MASEDSLEQALAGGAPQRVGWFRFYFADERWEWSEQVQLLHGYEPGTVTPTTELVLSHKHPEDRQQVAATLDEMRRTHRTFSTRHRIIDTGGDIHEVVVIGDQLLDEDGRLVGTHGFYVDMTPTDAQTKTMLSRALAEITENRAVIEQVKGMLMLIYRVDDDAAFELLRWRSQETNVKLRVLAEQLLSDYRMLVYEEALPPRATFDHLLLTAHLRVQAAGDTVNT